jgi:glycosyl-4,4'-diaponeurosporenoate acyltransferase
MADSLGATVAVDTAAWAALSVAFGYAGRRLPTHWLFHDTPITRIRAFENQGRTWQKYLVVRRWKDRLPEAGAFFGGVSKKHLRSRAGLHALLPETRRAELVHWALVASAPLFALWNPAPLTVAMVAFAMVANVPCIVVQRFNRARLLRLAAIEARRSARR